MSSDRADPGESALLERARSGSDAAYQELVEVHRAELHAHCYRILGSVQDAEDALQDALLRAWRGLAFVAALQYLPPLQRAVLIVREVLGFSNKETAELLDTTVPAVQSALQRGRAAAQDRIPGRSQQATVRTLGDKRLRELAGRYCDAIERADVDAVVGLLTEDATWAMPPVPTWYRGRPAIAWFLRNYAFNESWRHIVTQASGQLAVGCYTFDPPRQQWVASILDVLTLDGDRIAEVTSFVTAELLSRWGSEDDRFVGATAFPRFGLPAVLPD